MEDAKNALPEAGLVKCAENPEKITESSGKNRMLLAATLAVCILAVDTVLFSSPGLGVTVTVLAWYALTAAALGPGCFRRGEGQFLLAVNVLLAASFTVQSNWYFRIWNLEALAVLVPIHLFALAGTARRPWWDPSMLWERAGLLFRGLFGSLGAAGAAAAGKKRRGKRIWAGALGILGAAVLVGILLPVLASADALFASVTQSFLDFCRAHLTEGLIRVLLGLGLTPFAFGLLWSLRYPREREAKPERPKKTADALPFLILLAALDLLYLLFLAVQGAGLAGGAAYLARRGISYADWARSGFFQMVGVTAVNLTVTLAALHWSARKNGGRGALRPLATLLTAESLALLASAAWRMSLYVHAYGLSFKRAMTYWGMAMMGIFLAAALAAVWRPTFRFCRTAFLAALIGWAAVSCVPVSAMVARDSVSRYLDGRSAAVDVAYLTAGDLGFGALGPLSKLDTGKESRVYVPGGVMGQAQFRLLLEEGRQRAAAECRSWESWNLSAYLASRGEKGK
ncbi:MAG: DUF4173 domain-containing protein [Oscillibacter sp.]|jgi:hypothetical protein|nr:DUF4173 domain-containing protein [Oscillibacter sp.]